MEMLLGRENYRGEENLRIALKNEERKKGK